MPVFSEEVDLDGQAGEYEFLANFEKGAAASGGRTNIFLVDPKEMPAVEREVVMWGEDTELASWLSSRGIKVRQFSPGSQQSREVILVSRTPADGGARAFRELARHIARGSVAVFLSQEVFARDAHPLGWLPLSNKGEPSFLKPDKKFYEEPLASWLYLKDEWAKAHPIFDGLPADGLMDNMFYREIIPDSAWIGQDPPLEASGGRNQSLSRLFVRIDGCGSRFGHRSVRSEHSPDTRESGQPPCGGAITPEYAAVCRARYQTVPCRSTN